MKRVALVLAFIVTATFLVLGSLSNTVQASRLNLGTVGRGQPEQAERPEGATSTPISTATCVPFVCVASAQNPVIVDGGVKPARPDSKQATASLPAVVKSRSGSPAKLVLPAAPNVVLLDQYDNDLGNGIVSANRTDSPTFSAEAADDFVVPACETWQINQLDVRARVGFPNPASFNVYIYTESGALPGTAIYTATNLAAGGTNPDYVIDLTAPANLATGTYWVSVQGNIVGANWYWQGRSVLDNNSTAWREGGAYRTACANGWNRLTTCAGFSWPGQMFRLNGTIGSGGCATSTIVPSSTSSSTATVIPVLTSTQTSVPTGTTVASVTSVSTSTATSVATYVATSTATVTACSITFSDVLPSDYFYEPVRYLYCAGAISGYADNTFRPYNDTTRGQLSKIVVLAEGFPINTGGGPHFSDVPETNPFYAFVETANNRGLISGYADGTFRPGNNVTRGQLSKIVVLAMGWSLYIPSTPTFSDVGTGNAFYSHIETAYAHGIISGYADGTFRPGNNATRGQIAKIVYGAISAP